jgi:hypothetical protein
MPPLILVAAGAVGAVAAIRWLRKESRRINAELHPDDVVEEPGPRRKLVRDPVTGHYRPE